MKTKVKETPATPQSSIDKDFAAALDKRERQLKQAEKKLTKEVFKGIRAGRSKNPRRAAELVKQERAVRPAAEDTGLRF